MKKILSTIFLVLILITTGCGKEVIKRENDIVNVNEEVIKDQIIDSFLLTQTTVIYSNGMTNFKVKLINEGEDKYINYLVVNFKGNNDYTLKTYKIPVKETIKNNDQKIITMSSDINLANAYKITYGLE